MQTRPIFKTPLFVSFLILLAFSTDSHASIDRCLAALKHRGHVLLRLATDVDWAKSTVAGYDIANPSHRARATQKQLQLLQNRWTAASYTALTGTDRAIRYEGLLALLENATSPSVIELTLHHILLFTKDPISPEGFASLQKFFRSNFAKWEIPTAEGELEPSPTLTMTKLIAQLFKLQLHPSQKKELRIWALSLYMTDMHSILGVLHGWELSKYTEANPNRPFMTRESDAKDYQGPTVSPFNIMRLIENASKIRLTQYELENVLQYMSTVSTFGERVTEVRGRLVASLEHAEPKLASWTREAFRFVIEKNVPK